MDTDTADRCRSKGCSCSCSPGDVADEDDVDDTGSAVLSASGGGGWESEAYGMDSSMVCDGDFWTVLGLSFLGKEDPPFSMGMAFNKSSVS